MAKRPATKAKPKISDLEADAHELLKVSAERKALEKRESALKLRFIKEADGAPMLFVFGDVTIETALDTRTTVDSKAVREDHGEKYDRTTEFLRVIAREGKEAA